MQRGIPSNLSIAGQVGEAVKHSFVKSVGKQQHGKIKSMDCLVFCHF